MRSLQSLTSRTTAQRLRVAFNPERRYFSTTSINMVKRLIVACDGTWVNSDNGFVRESWLPWKTEGTIATPSNVTRICRALNPKSEDGIQQVTYYQGGLGSANNAYSYFVGGFLGEGISENIREAYGFLCNNYEEGDEIILIGFSRGAFTARSVGGLISAIGLLTRKGLGSFYPVFKDWENQMDQKYVPKWGSMDWPDTRPKFGDKQYMAQLIEKGLTRPNIPVKAIGVWDTVGALGIPTLKLFGFTIHTDSEQEYSFINTEVAPNVENAYQALALDDERVPFRPTVWEHPAPNSGAILKELKQCWFPGVHSSIGGGYEDTNISDMTLAWMMTQLSKHVSFDRKYMIAQGDKNREFYSRVDEKAKASNANYHAPIRSWGFGLIRSTKGGIQGTLAGNDNRTPGEYHELDPRTGKATAKQLVDTREFMHPSVRYRILKHGPGLSTSKSDVVGQGVYNPPSLKDWTWCPPGQPWGRQEFGIPDKEARWDSYGKWLVRRTDGSVTFIVEEPVAKDSFEGQLLDGWAGVRAEVEDHDVKRYVVGGGKGAFDMTSPDGATTSPRSWGSWFKSVVTFGFL